MLTTSTPTTGRPSGARPPKAARRSVAELEADAAELLAALEGRVPPRDADELVQLRHAT